MRTAYIIIAILGAIFQFNSCTNDIQDDIHGDWYIKSISSNDSSYSQSELAALLFSNVNAVNVKVSFSKINNDYFVNDKKKGTYNINDKVIFLLEQIDTISTLQISFNQKKELILTDLNSPVTIILAK